MKEFELLKKIGISHGPISSVPMQREKKFGGGMLGALKMANPDMAKNFMFSKGGKIKGPKK